MTTVGSRAYACFTNNLAVLGQILLRLFLGIQLIAAMAGICVLKARVQTLFSSYLFTRQDDSVAVRELTLEDIRPFVSDPAKAAANIEALLATLAVSQGDDAKDEELRAWASDALQSVEWVEESIADRVAEYCTHDSAAAAVWACKLIAKSSDSAGRFQSPLVEALKRHPDRTVRQQAASALGSQTRLTAQAIEALEQAASSKDPRLSRLARRSLERHEAA